MQIDLSKKEFRRLLDMVYIGNWILNSTRGDDRFADYDDLESKLFALCRGNGMDALVERYEGTDVPSRAFSDGGIHEAIMDYEDTVFDELLAEALARRGIRQNRQIPLRRFPTPEGYCVADRRFAEGDLRTLPGKHMGCAAFQAAAGSGGKWSAAPDKTSAQPPAVRTKIRPSTPGVGRSTGLVLTYLT